MKRVILSLVEETNKYEGVCPYCGVHYSFSKLEAEYMVSNKSILNCGDNRFILGILSPLEIAAERYKDEER